MSDELRKQKVERVTAALLDLLQDDGMPVTAELAPDLDDPFRPFTREEVSRHMIYGPEGRDVFEVLADMINERLGTSSCTADMVCLAQRYAWVLEEAGDLQSPGELTPGCRRAPQ